MSFTGCPSDQIILSFGLRALGPGSSSSDLSQRFRQSLAFLKRQLRSCCFGLCCLTRRYLPRLCPKTFLYPFDKLDHAWSRRAGVRSKGATRMDEPPISRGFRSRRQEQTLEKPDTARTVCDDGFSGSFGGTYAANQDWRLDFSLQLDGSLLGKWTGLEFEALPRPRSRRIFIVSPNGRS